MKLALSVLMLAAACGPHDTTTMTTTTRAPATLEEESGAPTVAEEHASAPAETTPEPDAQRAPVAALDDATVKRVIMERAQRIKSCYHDALAKQPTLESTTTVTFTITPSGQVEGAVGSGVEPTFDRCLANVVATLVFPPSALGQVPTWSGARRDRAEIRRVMRERLPAFYECYERAVVLGAPVPSRVEIHVTIAPDGAPMAAGCPGAGEAVERCCAAALASVTFGPASTPTTVVYPISLDTAGY